MAVEITDTVVWNPPWAEHGPFLARDLDPTEGVHPTSYNEVHALVGTSGCSPKSPYWGWEVCATLDTPRGKLLVVPGDRLQLDQWGRAQGIVT